MNPNQTHGNMPGDSVPGPSSASDDPDMAMHMGAPGQLMQQPPPEQKEQSISQREPGPPPIVEDPMDMNIGQPPPHPRREQQMPHLMYASIPHPSDQPRMQVTRSVVPQRATYPPLRTFCPSQQVVPPIHQQIPQRIGPVQHQQFEQLHQCHCQCDIQRNGRQNSEQMANPINEPIDLSYPRRMNFSNSEPIRQQQLTQPIPQQSSRYIPQHPTSLPHQQISSLIGQLNPWQVPQPGPSRAPTPQIQDSWIESLFPSLRDAFSQRAAASSAELAQCVARYLPQDSSNPTNTDAAKNYLRYLVSIKVQIAFVNEIHDILVAAAQNQPSVQERHTPQ